MMVKNLEKESRLADAALLVFRVAVALMLTYFHGFDKLTSAWANVAYGQEWGFIGFVASIGFPLARFFAVCAALAESFGSLLMAVGLFTRYGSAMVSVTMMVAVYYHASSDGRIELAALYFLASFLFVFVHPGRYSVDHWLSSRAGSREATEVVA